MTPFKLTQKQIFDIGQIEVSSDSFVPIKTLEHYCRL